MAYCIFGSTWDLTPTGKKDAPFGQTTSDAWGTWVATLDRIIEEGAIAHRELESVIGRLSRSQTSVFGRIGRATMPPLYTNLRLGDNYPPLSLKADKSLSWSDVALAHMKPRMEPPRHPRNERIVYADEAGKSGIIASVCIMHETCVASDRLDAAQAPDTGHRWRKTFGKTFYIYGLDSLSVLEMIHGKSSELRNRSVTFYIENDNFLCALINNAANPPEIQAMVGLIWHRIRDLRIAPWFESVPSKRNIAACQRAERGLATIPRGMGLLVEVDAYAASRQMRLTMLNRDSR